MRSRWLLGAVLVGACYDDPDRFNERQAEILCELEEKCGGEFGVGAMDGLSCEDSRIDELSQCTAVCDYDEDAARSCVRGIREALRPTAFGPDCMYDAGTLDDCAKVYTNCEAQAPGEHLSCSVDEPDLGCAFVPDGRTPWALVVLALALPLRRRFKLAR